MQQKHDSTNEAATWKTPRDAHYNVYSEQLRTET